MRPPCWVAVSDQVYMCGCQYDELIDRTVALVCVLRYIYSEGRKEDRNAPSHDSHRQIMFRSCPPKMQMPCNLQSLDQ